MFVLIEFALFALFVLCPSAASTVCRKDSPGGPPGPGVTSNDPERSFAITQFLLSNQAIAGAFGQAGDPAMISQVPEPERRPTLHAITSVSEVTGIESVVSAEVIIIEVHAIFALQVAHVIINA